MENDNLENKLVEKPSLKERIKEKWENFNLKETLARTFIIGMGVTPTVVSAIYYNHIFANNSIPTTDEVIFGTLTGIATAAIYCWCYVAMKDYNNTIHW